MLSWLSYTLTASPNFHLGSGDKDTYLLWFVNQNFRNEDLIEVKRHLFGVILGLQAGKHRFKKHLNCVLLDYKVGEVCKGSNYKVTVSYTS